MIHGIFSINLISQWKPNLVIATLKYISYDAWWPVIRHLFSDIKVVEKKRKVYKIAHHNISPGTYKTLPSTLYTLTSENSSIFVNVKRAKGKEEHFVSTVIISLLMMRYDITDDTSKKRISTKLRKSWQKKCHFHTYSK